MHLPRLIRPRVEEVPLRMSPAAHRDDSPPGFRDAGFIRRIGVIRALRSDNTDACHSQGAQGTDSEHPQAGSCQTAEDDGGQPGVTVLHVTGGERPWKEILLVALA